MNRNNLKKYAPEARREFIRAVTDRASYYGLTKKKTEPVTVEGDVAVISGRAFPKKVAEQRKQLEEKVGKLGFEQVMEAVAYTWFNRLVAIRYMELHGYLDHGYRVLSHPEGDVTPEIVEHAEHLDLPGLDKQKVISLKLDGTKESELYRMLLIAQCNALHKAMPFLFEHIGDETELLLPDNLLHSDSLIRTLVKEIPEEDWQEVEIIGWLYQFYISEKKDQVIGKVVKSEDIPAATQLFTPNWIVKYLVQNSLGRQWMATYPNSSLKAQMEYYIEPAEQTPEVQEQLKAITPESLTPEELTLLDPACGSGHILVEAYDLLKAIYQERGYRAKDIPRLILEKNLYGLEIDDRAAQLAAFALMMKARADDRHIFAEPVQLHVLAIQESKGLDAAEVFQAIQSPRPQGGKGAEDRLPSLDMGNETEDSLSTRITTVAKNESPSGPVFTEADVAELIQLFEHGKTFGSLIRVPDTLKDKLAAIVQHVGNAISHGEILDRSEAKRFRPVIQQARLLSSHYDAIVTNPPYMGSKAYCALLKEFVSSTYTAGKADLYGAFTLRNIQLTKCAGYIGMITIPNWMFLSSFEDMRSIIYREAPITSLVHNGRGVWNSDFGSCSFILRRTSIAALAGRFLRLFEKQGSVADNVELEKRFHTYPRFTCSTVEFRQVPGIPVAYWLSDSLRATFRAHRSLGEVASPKEGLNTTDNNRFLRRWWECGSEKTKLNARSAIDALSSGAKWFPCQKGGDYRKWYGNNEYVVNWHDNGREIKATIAERYGSVTKRVVNEHLYFREGTTWSSVSIASLSMRFVGPGHIFETAGNMCFFNSERELLHGLGLCNSCVVGPLLQCLSPTVSFKPGPVGRLPFAATASEDAGDVTRRAVRAAKIDWDSHETSWEFTELPLLQADHYQPTLKAAYTKLRKYWQSMTSEMKNLEELNNQRFVDAYRLQDELTSSVPLKEVTLICNPAYRYGTGRTYQELEQQLGNDTVAELVSYTVGCMMGRYSLDKPGLIYARSGGEGFDPAQYQTFPADADGIVPITDFEWFEDDAANRLEDFVATAWPKEHLEENLKFIADSLGPNKGERPRETIRRYLSTTFYKHHLSMYRKRPIYWLFSSGKQRAFQCLVYLHRYNEGTLSRMRTEYVIPLSGQMSSRIDQLEGDIAAAASTSHRKKLEKERQTLIKQREELQAFDEQLRHYADQRIKLDLDDGVKVNYGKFGNLLAEVKAVTGTNAE